MIHHMNTSSTLTFIRCTHSCSAASRSPVRVHVPTCTIDVHESKPGQHADKEKMGTRGCTIFMVSLPSMRCHGARFEVGLAVLASRLPHRTSPPILHWRLLNQYRSEMSSIDQAGFGRRATGGEIVTIQCGSAANWIGTQYHLLQVRHTDRQRAGRTRTGGTPHTNTTQTIHLLLSCAPLTLSRTRTVTSTRPSLARATSVAATPLRVRRAPSSARPTPAYGLRAWCAWMRVSASTASWRPSQRSRTTRSRSR